LLLLSERMRDHQVCPEITLSVAIDNHSEAVVIAVDVRTGRLELYGVLALDFNLEVAGA